MRACSAFTERFSSPPENQPETSLRRCFANWGASFAASIGNLTPVSVPEKHALRLSRRHVSSVVSPPSCGRSLFDQAIGATPRRIGPAVGILDADPLAGAAGGHIGAGGADLLALAHLRHADVPPGIAGRPFVRLDLDDDDVG